MKFFLSLFLPLFFLMSCVRHFDPGLRKSFQLMERQAKLEMQAAPGIDKKEAVRRAWAKLSSTPEAGHIQEYADASARRADRFRSLFEGGHATSGTQPAVGQNPAANVAFAPGSSRFATGGGTATRSFYKLPAFVTRDYPFADTATTMVKHLSEPTHIKEWGFQDLVAPAGTQVVKMRLCRSQVVLENQNRVFGGSVYFSGDVKKEGKIRDALLQEHARGGCPRIIVTAYFDHRGSRIETLPITIEYYGGVRKGRLDGMISPFKLDPNLERVIFSSSPPRVNPEDMRCVFMYSGMASNSGFSDIGFFVPISLADANHSWTRGSGYFGRFRSGQLVEKITLESFGGPLALEAQRKARERGQMMADLAGMTLLGGAALITAGALKVGDMTWELYKEGVSLQAQNSRSNSGAANSSSELSRFAKRYHGGTWKFIVTRDANNGRRGDGATITLKDPEIGKEWEVSYSAGFTDQFNKGNTGALTLNNESLVGARVEVYFHGDGEPVSIKNLNNGNTCRVRNWKVTGYGW